tara:strand:+ start:181 stop:390 length:210 start_codon:yes stop_codon:yes gene_type:complete
MGVMENIMGYFLKYHTRPLDYREVGGEYIHPEWRILPTEYSKEVARDICDAFELAGIKAYVIHRSHDKG